MEAATKTRRVIAAALIMSALLVAAPTATAPARAALVLERRTVSERLCDYDWREGTRQVKQLIRCAARRWDVSGGPDKALSVARCESRFDPKAYNPAGYLGVFQQAKKYWPDRADRWGFPDISAFNGRANIIVSIRMAHGHGWGAWGCG